MLVITPETALKQLQIATIPGPIQEAIPIAKEILIDWGTSSDRGKQKDISDWLDVGPLLVEAVVEILRKLKFQVVQECGKYILSDPELVL